MYYRYIPCFHCNALNRADSENLKRQAKCGKCKQILNTFSNIFEVNSKILENIILQSPIPILVDFWAPWCGPCQGFAPIYTNFAQKYPNSAIYLKLNTDADKTANLQFNIRGIPTLILFENGIEKSRQNGAIPIDILEQWLTKNGLKFPNNL